MNDITDLHEIYIKYKILYDRYLIELKRASNIESKATCIIGFVAVLLVFSANLGINNFNKVGNHYLVLLLYGICIILFIITFAVSMKTLLYGNSNMRVLNTEYIISGCAPKNIDIIKIICEELYDITQFNSYLVSNKNILLRLSIGMFIVSSSCLMSSFMLTFWCINEQPNEANDTTNYPDNFSMNTPESLSLNSQQVRDTPNIPTLYDVIYNRKLNISDNKMIVNSSVNK